MKNSVELMISKRPHQRVDMIGHDDIFAKQVTLSAEELKAPSTIRKITERARMQT